MPYTYTSQYIEFTLTQFITNVNFSNDGKITRSIRSTTSTISKFNIDYLKLSELNNFGYNLYEYLLANIELYEVDNPLPYHEGYFSNLLSISSKFDCEHHIHMSQAVYQQCFTSDVYLLVFVINRCLTQDVYKYTTSTIRLYDNRDNLFNEIVIRRGSNDSIIVEIVTPRPPSAKVLMAVQRGLSYAMENYELQYFNRINQGSLAYENPNQQHIPQFEIGSSSVKIITGITS
jgi:hypothetical protein